MSRPFKIPLSVLVVIHTPQKNVLLMRRTGLMAGGAPYWQSVTGSKDSLEESFRETAVREVAEETGIDCSGASPLHGSLQDWELENIYDIYPSYRHRYAPGMARNTEHLFGLCVPEGTAVQLNPREHTDYLWLPWQEAAERCYSSSNAEAILMLPRFMA